MKTAFAIIALCSLVASVVALPVSRSLESRSVAFDVPGQHLAQPAMQVTKRENLPYYGRPNIVLASDSEPIKKE